MDYQLEQWLNGPAGHQPLVDNLAVFIAAHAELAFILLVAIWFLTGTIAARPDDQKGALSALVAAGFALLANSLIAHAWVRPRPFLTHAGTVHLLLTHSPDASFPSDHAAAAFAIATVLVTFHRRAGTAALAFAAVMSVARVYVGDHYPGDVLAGAVIGLAVSALLLAWLQPARAWIRRCLETSGSAPRRIPQGEPPPRR